MKTVVALVAGAMLLALYYIEGIEDNRPLPSEYTQGPEALGWLRKSNNESALASNRFLQTHNAATFVRQLITLGPNA